ncbi:alpha/beta hydrolase [Enterococcus sp. LJL90]
MAEYGNYIFELAKNVERTNVKYKNRYGIEIAGDVYYGADTDLNEKNPAIIIGAPYGGVKEQGPGVYANQLAQQGFIVLTFDPSFNGYSGGEPRHVSSADIFVEDFSAAVDFIGTRAFVNRDQIGVIGICGSGGFALSAAQVDVRIKAVATISMYDISRAQQGEGLSLEERNQQLAELAAQRYIDFETNQPKLGPRGAAIGFDDTTDPIGREFGEFYSTPRGYHPNSITQFTVTSTMSMMYFPILSNLQAISPRPILLVMGENAHSRFFSEDVYAQANDPKELYIVPNAGHVDLYDKLDLIPFNKLTEFFKENLTK